MRGFSIDRLNLQFDRNQVLILLVFGVNLFLVFNFFFPTMRDVNVWDESVYVNTGRSMAEGQLPPFARNPLIGVLYGLTYLPFLNSPFWLVQSIALGRIVLFSLMWLSSYLIASRLSRFFPPLTMAGFLLVLPILLEILLNPSDALFAATSGFAFWQVLCFYDTRAAKHLWRASAFVGLAALSRNDGLVLFVIFVLLVILLIGRTRWNPVWLAAVFVPFIGLTAGYLLLYGVVTGDFSLGTQERSYVAFQQGQSIDYHRDPSCNQKPLKCAVLQAEQLYGTGEENNYSIFNAIRRNPQAYLSRLRKQLGALPDLALSMLGARTAFLFLILFARGVLELFRRKQWMLMALLLIWPAFLGVYFLTIFRIGYLRMPYYILYVIAAIGAAAFVADAFGKRSSLAWAALLILVTGGAMIADVRALYFAAVLLLAALGLIYLFSQDQEKESSALVTGLLLLLCAGLILRPTLDPPVRRDPAAGEEEQALLAIARSLPPGSPVAAGAPGWVWAARMDFQDMNGEEFTRLTSGREVYELLKSRGVQAVYVDGSLSNANEYLWLLMEPDLDQWYQTVYSGREGSIRVLLLK